MQMAHKNSSNVEEKQVETFESLTEKQSVILKEISALESELKTAHDALSNAKSLNKQVKEQNKIKIPQN